MPNPLAMHDSTVAAGTARHAFLAKLIDDASLFPPVSLPVEAAIAAHVALRTGPYGWLQGQFVVPARRVGELADIRRPVEEPLSLSLVLDPGPGAWLTGVASELQPLAEAFGRIGTQMSITALETRVPINTGTKALRGIMTVMPPLLLRHELDLYFELALGDHWRDDLPAIADAIAGLDEELLHAGEPVRAGAKLRCGGPSAPTSEQVASFISEFAERHVRIKLSSGLHPAIRTTDPATGTAQQGFVNVIGAAIFCDQRMLDDLELVEVLDEADASAFTLDDDRFAWRDFTLTAAAVTRARERFVVCFGSCDTNEPLEDLRLLGLLP